MAAQGWQTALSSARTHSRLVRNEASASQQQRAARALVSRDPQAQQARREQLARQGQLARQDQPGRLEIMEQLARQDQPGQLEIMERQDQPA